MSIRENIELYHTLDLEKYLEILGREWGAEKHPSQAGVLMVDGLPFYSPKKIEDHISFLGFNKVPLPYPLLQVLIGHPELVPDDVFVRWTQEQELILECTFGELRRQINRDSDVT